MAVQPEFVNAKTSSPGGLKKAGIDYRLIIQARHTFSTMTVSAGENPGWVQRTMGAGFLDANEGKTGPMCPRYTPTLGRGWQGINFFMK